MGNNVSKKNNSLKRFMAIYLILTGVFFLLISLEPVRRVVDVNGLYTGFVVLVISKILFLLGIPVEYKGHVLELSSFALDIRFGCNGLEAVIIYSVAVLSFPTVWKKRVLGILFGFIGIQVVNLLRVVLLVLIAVYRMDVFEIAHLYVFQGIMIVVSFGIFLIFVDFANHGKINLKMASG
jgi:exosortase/archaeosortase family protein